MSKVYYMGSDAEFGWFGSKIGRFISHAAAAAGKQIGKGVGKIPIVGAPINTVMSSAYKLTMAPLTNTVDAAIHGKRLDRAILNTLSVQMRAVKDVAPYAKTLVTLVPGVGTGIGAALGAGLALANGQPIDKAFLAGVTQALPGGPLAQAAANAAASAVQAAARGEKLSAQSVSGTLLNSLPIPPAAKEALMAGAHVAGSVASGKNVAGAISDATFKKALTTLPPDIRKAYLSGMALGGATVAQSHRAQELATPSLVNKLVESGIQAAKSTPAIQEARKLVGPGVRGFDLAQGLLTQHSQPFDIIQARASFKSPQDLRGFDMGLATRIGLVAHPLNAKLSPAAQAGQALVLGVQGMEHAENRKAIVDTVAAHPSAAVGGKVAAMQIAQSRDPWYIKLARALGLHK